MRTLHGVVLGAGILAAVGAVAAAQVTVFDGSLEGWEREVFAEETRYQLVDPNGERVIRADSRNSASGLYREIEVDLTETPYLNWSWRVDNTLEDVDETTKAGDDYPARIYVVRSGGLFFWQTKAVNYVWASQQPQGATWPNAFTNNARMVAVESGDARSGQWVQEQRNVREDFRQLFSDDVTKIHAIAIMTDTDNSGGEATAYYRDIYFSAEPSASQ